jgi:S1-C subfamily serine protease
MAIAPSRGFRPSRLVFGALLFLLVGGACADTASLAPSVRPGASPNVPALVEQVRTKVVLIDAQVGRGGRAGTGFFAAPGQVLTSEHVIHNADRIIVWANGVPYRAQVLYRDHELDLALLALPESALLIKPLPLAATSSTLPGEPVLIVGTHPAPTTRSVRQSLISGEFRGPSWFEWPPRTFSRALELSATVEPGDSGSPVIRVRDGAVIGVVRARETPSDSGISLRAWAVPIDMALDLLGHTEPRKHQAARPGPDDEYYLRQP